MRATRRQVLRAAARAALGVGVAGPLGSILAGGPRPARAAGADAVVVAVNLVGGNDGLNTVVPLRQYDAYRALRPQIGLPLEALLPLPGAENDFALNPGLAALLPLLEQGKVAVINGVGCPLHADGLFNHEASQANFLSGTTDGTAPRQPPSGWLGRWLDGVVAGELPAGFDFTGARLLLSGRQHEPLVLQGLASFSVAPSRDAVARLRAYDAILALPVDSAVGEHGRRLRHQARDLSQRLQAILLGYRAAAGVAYPLTFLGRGLRDCAALIAADRGVRACQVSAGGFDTHLLQMGGPPAQRPLHERLLAGVAVALAAFHRDLEGHGVGRRVVTVVFSEFGRRAAENSYGGTDHGLGSTLLVIGDAVRGGVFGDSPSLQPDRLVLDGNLDAPVDFRRVYATLLSRHLGADAPRILGAPFAELGFLA